MLGIWCVLGAWRVDKIMHEIPVAYISERNIRKKKRTFNQSYKTVILMGNKSCEC